MFPRIESQNAIPAYMIRNLTVNVNAGTPYTDCRPLRGLSSKLPLRVAATKHLLIILSYITQLVSCPVGI